MTEDFSFEIKITKEEVRRVTDCPNAIDGDSTAWYDYVGEAIEMGANYDILGVIKSETVESWPEEARSYSIDNVEWL